MITHMRYARKAAIAAVLAAVILLGIADLAAYAPTGLPILAVW
jgi:hypothetical protein